MKLRFVSFRRFLLGVLSIFLLAARPGNAQTLKTGPPADRLRPANEINLDHGTEETSNDLANDEPPPWFVVNTLGPRNIDADPASAGPSLPGPGRLRRGIAGRLKSHRNGALFALIAAIAGADVVFAMDSIPAVFGLTRDPYLVLAANVFALLGLRHLYFLIGGLLDRLVHLTAGLSAILAFIGAKLIAEALADSGVHRVGPVPVPHIDTWVSLCVIGGVLAVVTVTSLLATRQRGGREVSPSRSGHPAERPPRPGRPSESHR